MEDISSKEVAQKFADAIEFLLDWLDQRIASRNKNSAALEIPSANNERLLSVTEVAKILSISKSQTYKLIVAKLIPGVRLGHSVRVRSKDLSDLIERQKTS